MTPFPARTLKGQLNEALLSVGIAPMSKRTAARLLALCHVFGGSSEAWTHTLTLVDDLEAARRLLAINTEEADAPDPEGVRLIQAATDELLPEGVDGPWLAPDWAKTLAQRYGVPLIGRMGDPL